MTGAATVAPELPAGAPDAKYTVAESPSANVLPQTSQKNKGKSVLVLGGLAKRFMKKTIGRVRSGMRRTGTGLDAFKRKLNERVNEKLNLQLRNARLEAILLCLSLLAYIFLGGLAYMLLEEGWTYADGIYFSIVTISTVGFGDLNPSTDASRLFTVIYGTIGVFVTFAELCQLLAKFHAHAIERALAYQGQVRENLRKGVSFTSTTLDDRLLDCISDQAGALSRSLPLLAYYVKGSVTWLIVLFAFQLLSALAYVEICRGEDQSGELHFGYDYDSAEESGNEPLSFGVACWHVWVVASTIGYGLVAGRMPGTPSMRAFASVHIIFGTTLLASTVGHLLSLRGQRHAKLRALKLKNATLDKELIEALDRDGNGVDRMEYVVGMLTQLGLISWNDVQPFLDQFDRFDVDKSGRLDRADLERMFSESRDVALAALDRNAAKPQAYSRNRINPTK